MITLQQILESQSDILNGSKVKLVRHKDSRTEYRDVIKDRKALLEYQKEQGKDIFKGCNYIVSFIGLERSRSVLFGVFKVNGFVIKDDKYYYDLEAVKDFDDLADRLVIDWGKSTISWHQWYHRQTKEVIEILPDGYIGNFRGLLNFTLDFDELKKMTINPEANIEWKNHLSTVNGIYMILDKKTGQQYIGSASGKNGIWQRWCNYAAEPSGGNRELTKLLDKEPDYYKNFQYSILQTLPSNISVKETTAIEGLYKNKLGSRAHGLNAN